MKKNKDTEEQIAFALKQAELGTPVSDVCREARDRRTDILPLEKQIRWDAAKRHEAAPAARGRERQAEEAGG